MGAITNYVTGDFFEGDEPDALALGSYDFIRAKIKKLEITPKRI